MHPEPLAGIGLDQPDAAALAETHALPLVIHVAETAGEVQTMRERYGRSPVQHLADLGVLSERTVAAHCVHLSAEDIEFNISESARILERMAKIDMSLEIELGVTGGEEDGVDNTGVDNASLYTQPEEVNAAYERLRAVSDRFTVAASFGNVHGVYKPGNVVLTPKILQSSQAFIEAKHGTGPKPVSFVFHGGSGSSQEEIREAIVDADGDIGSAVVQADGGDDDQATHRPPGLRHLPRAVGDRVVVEHPFVMIDERLARWLAAPEQALPGDSLMPRVQRERHGASERMVVSPGREELGIMHMPGGQSGHPWSRFFLAGHEAWERGEATPLLPGEARYRLRLVPGE